MTRWANFRVGLICGYAKKTNNNNSSAHTTVCNCDKNRPGNEFIIAIADARERP